MSWSAWVEAEYLHLCEDDGEAATKTNNEDAAIIGVIDSISGLEAQMIHTQAATMASRAKRRR